MNSAKQKDRNAVGFYIRRFALSPQEQRSRCGVHGKNLSREEQLEQLRLYRLEPGLRQPVRTHTLRHREKYSPESTQQSPTLPNCEKAPSATMRQCHRVITKDGR